MNNLDNLYEQGNETLTNAIQKAIKRGAAMGAFWGLAVGYFVFWNPELFASKPSYSEEDWLAFVSYLLLVFAIIVNIGNVSKSTLELQKKHGVKNLKYHGWKLGYLGPFCLFVSFGLKYSGYLLANDTLEAPSSMYLAHGSYFVLGVLALVVYSKSSGESKQPS